MASAFTRTNSQPSHAGNYTVVVSNSFGAVTSSIATLTLIQPPVISVQPADQTVSFGATVILSATVTGSGLSYQWTREENLVDGGNISGVTTPALTLRSVTQSEAASYALVVSNSAGVVVSSKMVENDEEVTVAFTGKGVKRLLASFAKLERVE